MKIGIRRKVDLLLGSLVGVALLVYVVGIMGEIARECHSCSYLHE